MGTAVTNTRVWFDYTGGRLPIIILFSIILFS